MEIVNPKVPTTISLSLSTDPILSIPDDEDNEYSGTQEDGELLYQAAAYLNRIKKEKVLVINYYLIF